MPVLVVGRGTFLDQVGQLPARALVVADFKAAGIDDGERVSGFGEFLGGLRDRLARAGLGQVAAEHGVDQRAFTHAGLARDQDVHAARAARRGADGVRDRVLQLQRVVAGRAHEMCA
ncbi:hypothetical protein D9M69_729950 [compost metagenome]